MCRFASIKKIIALLASLCAVACSGNKTTVYDFTAESNDGETVAFSHYEGKVLLIVNTASPATSSATRNPAPTRRLSNSAA